MNQSNESMGTDTTLMEINTNSITNEVDESNDTHMVRNPNTNTIRPKHLIISY